MRDLTDKQLANAKVLVTAERVRIIRAGGGECLALVRGGSLYTVQLKSGEWTCTCPLADFRPSWECKHVAAVRFVYEA